MSSKMTMRATWSTSVRAMPQTTPKAWPDTPLVVTLTAARNCRSLSCHWLTCGM